MPRVTVVGGEPQLVEAELREGRFLVDPHELPRLVGWRLEVNGLCQGEICVPVGDRARVLVSGRADLGRVADCLRRPTVAEPAARIMAVALDGEGRRQALQELRAPSFRLPDLDGRLHVLEEWRGRKKLLVTFASWCGCRYDLPGWQALHDELEPEGFTVVAVALDESPDDVRPWVDGIDLPVLVDTHHVLSELYAISNVPTVVWIDEDDNIVRPNGVAFGTDTFRSFTGVESGPHLAAVRRWVRDGVVPAGRGKPGQAVDDLSEDEVRARLHFRVAAVARRQGDVDVALRHFSLASDLAPYDWTVRRAAMPLTGEDPFGPRFLDLYEEWKAAGMPYHGLPAAITAER